MVSLLKSLPTLCPLSVCMSQLLRVILNYTWKRKTITAARVWVGPSFSSKGNTFRDTFLFCLLLLLSQCQNARAVNPFHVDQRSKNSGLLLLLQDYDRKFDPECSCLQDACPKAWSLYVLPKQ